MSWMAHRAKWSPAAVSWQTLTIQSDSSLYWKLFLALLGPLWGSVWMGACKLSQGMCVVTWWVLTSTVLLTPVLRTTAGYRRRSAEDFSLWLHFFCLLRCFYLYLYFLKKTKKQSHCVAVFSSIHLSLTGSLSLSCCYVAHTQETTRGRDICMAVLSLPFSSVRSSTRNASLWPQCAAL